MIGREVPWSKIRYHWEIYLFVIPTLIMIGLFLYYPSASGIYHSFYRWNAADISEFVGLYNYLDLLSNPQFWDSFKVAFIIGGWAMFKMIPPILVAVCIHRCRSLRIQFWYRVLFVVPMVIPMLVMVLIWKSFFFEATSGYLNAFLEWSGAMNVLIWMDGTFGWGGAFAEGSQPAWLGDPRLILPAVLIWGFPWVGSFAVLMHLAKLQGIDRQIYEASDIDGVSWWTKFTQIELPLIMGSIYVLLVFAIIESIKDAGTILLLASFEGGPGGVVTVPALFMLRKAFVEQKLGYACAVGIILTVVVLFLQKLTSVWVNWETLKRHQKVAYRISVLALAGVLIYFQKYLPLALILIFLAFPSHWLATALAVLGIYLFRSSEFLLLLTVLALLFAFPYRQAAEWLVTKGKIGQPIARLLDGLRHYQMEKIQEGLARPPRRIDKIKEYNARAMKHLTIWFVLALAFIPVYLMVVVSVKTNTQFYEAPASVTTPFHWGNWAIAWDIVGPSIANTIYIATLGTVLALFLSLCAAYFFARLQVPMSGLFWNLILILLMMPTVANLVPLFRLLDSLDMINKLSTLILLGAAQGQVMAIFMLRTFVADIPGDLFEAAEIDGAGHFRQMWTVVLPLSGPILGTVGVMQFVALWNEFLMALIIIHDNIRLPIMVQLMRLAGEYIKLMGPMMAGYTFASIPIIVLFAFSMKLFVRGMTEGAVKA